MNSVIFTVLFIVSMALCVNCQNATSPPTLIQSKVTGRDMAIYLGIIVGVPAVEISALVLMTYKRKKWGMNTGGRFTGRKFF